MSEWMTERFFFPSVLRLGAFLPADINKDGSHNWEATVNKAVWNEEKKKEGDGGRC